MSIISRINEFLARASRLLLGGGREALESQKKKGKLTVRERLDLLLDQGSFIETDLFVEHSAQDFGMSTKKLAGDGVVTGIGRVDRRPVAVFAQDFSVAGGSLGRAHAGKITKVMDCARDMRIPLIGINDSGGARIQEGVDSLCGYGEIFYRNTQLSGVVPQLSVILGPCAGGAVYSPALTDFVFVVDRISNMFITGPQVIKAVTGEVVDAETLGGAEVHSSVSGVAHLVGEDEWHTLALARTLLSYLPSNNCEPPPAVPPTDDPWRMDPVLNSIVPTDPCEAYDMRQVIERVFDLGSFFEIHPYYAANCIVGFARLHGQVVGVVAQQPDVLAGVIDINAADKMARFIRFCDAFNIPLVTFVDSPGFLPGVNQEHGGIIRHGAKIVYAYAEATVPKLTVVARKAYGGAQVVMGSKAIRTDFVFAWPTAEIAVMGAEGAVNILYRKQIERSAQPEVERERLIAEYRQKFATPYAVAASGDVDDILVPAETRPRLIAALELLRDKRAASPARKHGSIPL